MLEIAVPISHFFDFHNSSFAHFWSYQDFPWSPLERLKNLCTSFPLGKIDVSIPPSTFIKNPETVFIEEGSLIEPGVYIEGMCVIQSGSIVRHGAYLREGVILGKNVIVGHCTEIKNSILQDRAKAPHFSYIGDSILGSDVNLGAGVKCANFRFDGEEIKIRYEQQAISSGRTKLGAIIGDGVQIGCNAVIYPGALIGKKSLCYPLSSLKGWIPPFSEIKQ